MRFLTTLALSLLILTAVAQAPQKMSYQAVVRNNTNELIINKAVGIRISILPGTPTGSPVYVETQTPTTNANGLFAIEIGGGTVVSGSFATIDWSHGPYFVQTQIDPSGGTAYSITGVSQLLSVPYALYAEKSGSPGPQGPAGAAGQAGPQGAAGAAGKGIASTINNGDGTYSFNFSDGSSFTTGNLTGPQGITGAVGAIGAAGSQGPAGAAGATGKGITSTVNNGNGTYTFSYSDGSSFTTADLTGPQGATGATGSAGSQGPVGSTGAAGTTGNGITSTVNNGNGTYTFSYSDGSTFTTADLTGPQGATGSTGAAGATGSPGAAGATGATGATGNGITSTVNNGNGTYTFNFSDASSFTTANLTGPTGATGATGASGVAGATGATGAAGKGITSTVNNGNGTYTFNYSDASSFTTANLTGPSGAAGAPGATGAAGAPGATGAAGAPGAQGPAGNPVDIAFRVYKTASGSQTNSTKIIYDGVSFNQGSGWSTITNTFTAPAAGIYQFTSNLYPETNNQFVYSTYKVNGVMVRGFAHFSRGLPELSTCLVKLNQGDTMELYYEGSTMSLFGHATIAFATYFEGFKIN